MLAIAYGMMATDRSTLARSVCRFERHHQSDKDRKVLVAPSSRATSSTLHPQGQTGKVHFLELAAET